MTMLFTIHDLIGAGACGGQVRAFKRCFGERALATVTTAVAHADTFDWEWAAWVFLRSPYYGAFCDELQSWDWECWRQGEDIAFDGYHAHQRFRAAAFAKAFLAQGGLPRSARFA